MSWGPLQILLVLVIVVLLFGTKKLRNLGGDLGSAIKSFKQSMSEGGKSKKENKTGANNAADGDKKDD